MLRDSWFSAHVYPKELWRSKKILPSCHLLCSCVFVWVSGSSSETHKNLEPRTHTKKNSFNIQTHELHEKGANQGKTTSTGPGLENDKPNRVCSHFVLADHMSEPNTEKQPEVFVVVPSYNHAPFVEKCLRSIIGQTLKPKKLLVIDDGSKDGSPAIIEKVLNDCPFASEFIARENRGLCATLNQGFDASDGKYFAYLGSDDLWLPRFLEEQTKLLRERKTAVLAFSHAYLIDEDSNITGSTADWNDFRNGDMLPLLMQGVVFSSPGVLYRRSALKKLRWNEVAKLEDYEMYLRLAIDGDFARNRKVLCGWRQHGDNASSRLPAMFSEMLASQARVAPEVGVDKEELARMQKQMKFAAVENFVRHGFRSEGARLFFDNIGGAESALHLARTAFRLVIPQSLFQWNRRRKRASAAERLGKIDQFLN